MIEQTDYRLAFILPHSRQLLGIACPGSLDFPVLSIPSFRRAADQLTRRIEERWKISAIILDIIAEARSQNQCAVVEVRTASWDFEHEGLSIARLDQIGKTSLTERQRFSLGAILSNEDSARGAFSRIGWIEEAQQWIQSSVDDHKVIFNGEIRQLNGGGTFCLVRLGTQTGPAYWIKGVGEPNTHEFAVTNFLAKHCSEHLPPIVAMRTDWNAWVMEGFGDSLQSSDSLDDFKHAAQELSKLQSKLAGKSRELLALPCVDHRIAVLDAKVDEIVEYLDSVMRQQTSTKATPLTPARLREIGDALHDVCRALADLAIPDSLMHGDLSPGSILRSGPSCVFTDWCEAYVGNPFISIEQLCVHVRRKGNEAEPWCRTLRDVYESSWTDSLTVDRISKAMQLVPLISVLSYLYGRGDWLSSARRHEPAVQSYARSLARHMDKIVSQTGPREALCPSS
jgi:hypothetical protein